MMKNDLILNYTQSHLSEIISWITGLVKIESPTDNKIAVNRAVEYVADFVAPVSYTHLTLPTNREV